MYKTFSERIRMLRLNDNMTMNEFAKLFNIKKSRVNMWESSNVSMPRIDILIRISNHYKVSIDYLLGNENMEGKLPENRKLKYILYILSKFDNKKLEKVESILKTVFDDIFEK
jgi:transcriptional regulator with XRE-family HTH domain